MSEPHLIPMLPADNGLRLHLSPDLLGMTPSQVWNPTPSVDHRTEPYDLPMSISIGIQGTHETGAKFSPSPIAIVVESGDRRLAVGVHADDGWHRWNDVDFHVASDGVRIEIDLEGHTEPELAAPHIRAAVAPAIPGEERLALVARLLSDLYPMAAIPHSVPPWWLRPIYCGWGDQVTVAQWLEGVGPEARALPYCTQGLYERWIRRLVEADVPFGTVCIDHGWSPAGSWEPTTSHWPDLKGFIARQHAAGRKVLLWIATWLTDGLPDEWCVYLGDTKLVADPTNPDYLAYVHDQVVRLLSPDGFDADGFKIDQLSYCPNEHRPYGGSRFGDTRHYDPIPTPMRLHGDGWGCELLHTLQRTIYEAAKEAKRDALVTSSTVHPYFHNTFDMVRLHDTGSVDADIFEAMGGRADLSRAAFPHKPIDADDWISMDYQKWLTYTSGSRRIGVPCIFFAERFMLDWRHEPATRPVPLDDLRAIGDAWRQNP